MRWFFLECLSNKASDYIIQKPSLIRGVVSMVAQRSPKPLVRVRILSPLPSLELLQNGDKMLKLVYKKVFFHIKNKSLLRILYSNLKLRFYAYYMDFKYLVSIKHPKTKFADRIWINANEIKYYIPEENIIKYFHEYKSRLSSGTVVRNKKIFDQKLSIDDLPKIKICKRHWGNGDSWEKAGLYHYYKNNWKHNIYPDNIEDYSKIDRRYSKLDKIFQEVSTTRQFKKQQEIHVLGFRAYGSVFVHIGPNGKVYFAGGGNHRLAMAQVLNLTIPAQIGLIYYKEMNTYKKLKTPLTN